MSPDDRKPPQGAAMTATKWFFVLLFLFTTQHIKVVDGMPVTAVFFVFLLPITIATRLATIDRRLIALFIWAAVTSFYSYFLSGGEASIASVVYLLAMMVPFVLVTEVTGRAEIHISRSFLSGFNSFMVLAAVLGVGQLALGDSFFSFRDLLPSDLRLEGFNTSNQVEFGGVFINRSNGFFFLEPSLFSQYLAFAILFEVRTTRNPARIALMSIGMVASFSGTGIVLLAIGLGLTAMSSRSAKDILVTVAPIVLLVAAIIYFLPSLAARITEVNDGDSSGYWRFGLPIVIMYNSYSTSLHNVLLGVGPGVAKNNLDTLLMAYSSGIGKILFENGILGSCGIVAMYYRFGMKSCHQLWLVLTLLVFILIINCGIQQPITLFTTFLLVFFAAPALRVAGRSRNPTRRLSSHAARKYAQPS